MCVIPGSARESDSRFGQPWRIALLVGVLSFLHAPAGAPAAEAATIVRVQTTAQLRAAVGQAGPGTEILLAPGTYTGPIYSERLQGAPGRPIVIAAAVPGRKPVIRGGGHGLKLVDPAHVEVRNLVFDGSDGTGVHIDDGGSYDTPAHDITLSGLEVRGSKVDGIKLIGVDRFRMEKVWVHDWRDRFWCGINVLGCHEGTIVACRITSTDDWGYGLQLKGGCERVAIQGCWFDHAGARALQVGGRTGPEFFRPEERRAGAEARTIVAERNVFIGSEAAIAFVSSEDVRVRYNTFYLPRTWVMRILRENTDPGVATARNSLFRDNLIVFDSRTLQETVNIGPDTAPETFRFVRNWWYCIDKPERSQPRLPSPETGGTVGVDPRFEDAARGDLRLKPDSPAQKVGAYAPLAEGG